MSMSSLGAQLATLNSTSTTSTTSRRPQDAIGRGLHHSTQHGHTLHNSQIHNPKLKPSVIHPSAKTAASIPISTIQTHAEASLRALKILTKNDAFEDKKYAVTLCGVASLNYERGMHSYKQNAQTDDLIVEMLILLTTVMSEPSNIGKKQENIYMTHSLNVVEYLLRRYDVHIRPTTAHLLLLYSLPHHDKVIFGRILQLVDLTNSKYGWGFLRPFAAPGCEALSRGVIVKNVAKDDALMECLGSLISQVSDVAKGEMKGGRVGNVRWGVSYVISFVAAVLTEALEIQSKDGNNKGSVKESSVRVLLPVILACCTGDVKVANKDEIKYFVTDQINFGYVLASTLVEYGDLNFKVKEAICTAIIRGISTMYKKQGQEEDSDDDDDEEEVDVEMAANGVLTLMSILLSPRGETAEEGEDEKESFLPLVESFTHQQHQKKKKQYSSNVQEEEEEWMGCILPKTTFKIFVDSHRKKAQPSSTTIISLALSYIYNVRQVADVPLILAAIFAKAINQIMNLTVEIGEEEGNRRKKKERQIGFLEDFMIAFINEEHLQSIYEEANNNLISSASAFLLNQFASINYHPNNNEDNKQRLLDICKSILNALHAANSAGCDAGVANAVVRLVESGGEEREGEQQQQQEVCRSRVAMLLKESDLGVDDAILAPSSSSKMDVDDEKEDESKDTLVNLLPPRVALEHPDAPVRLVAIERLFKEEVKSLEEDCVIEQDLMQALLRRIASDSEEGVVAAAGNALTSLEQKILDSSKENDDEVVVSMFEQDATASAEYILDALQKWSILDEIAESLANKDTFSYSKERLDAICTSLHLAGSAISAMLDEKEKMMEDEDDDMSMDEEDEELLHQLVCSVAAHCNVTAGFDMDGANDSLKELAKKTEDSASLALLRGFSSSDDDNDDDKSSNAGKVEKLLATSDVCIEALHRYCKIAEDEDERKKIDTATLRFLGLSLIFHVNALKSSTKSENEGEKNHLSDALSALVSILCLHGESKKRENVFPFLNSFLLEKLQACLKIISKTDLYHLPDTFVDIASVESSSAYNMVSAEAIRFIITEMHNNASSMLLLMEAASRPDNENFAVVRLISLACDLVDKTPFATCVGGGLIPAVSLLAHEDRNVREAALKYLEAVLSKKEEKNENPEAAKERKIILQLCTLATKENSPMRSAILMDGSSALSTLLAKASRNPENGVHLRETLLKKCTLGLTKPHNPSKSRTCWSLIKTPGGCHAAAILLSSIATAAADSFPLKECWKFAGSQLFSVFLEHSTSMDQESGAISNTSTPSTLNVSAKSLMETVVLMLKGVVVKHGSSSTIESVITTGPSNFGRRSRSYSIGSTDDVTIVKKYPEQMTDAILKCLSSTIKGKEPAYVSELQRSLIRLVLGRRSWAEHIFPKLNHACQRKIASSLLTLRSAADEESAGSALLMLPINSDDFASFMAKGGVFEVISNDEELLALTFLADCIRGRSDALAGDAHALKLSDVLFEKLSSLSVGNLNHEGSEYTRTCLLQTLLALHENLEKKRIAVPGKESSSYSRRIRSHERSFKLQASFLVSLMGEDESTKVRPLATGNGKAVALGVLTRICSESPATVVDSLIPAMLQICTASSSKVNENNLGSNKAGTPQVRSCGQALMAVVPSFFARASSDGLSLSDLINSFVCSFHSRQKIHPQQNLELYKLFVDALLSITSENDPPKALSELIGYYIAADIYHSENSGKRQREDDTAMDISEDILYNSVAFALKILHHAPATTQVYCSLQLLRYARDLIGQIENGKNVRENKLNTSKGLVNGITLANMAVSGAKELSEKRLKTAESLRHKSMMILSSNLLKIIMGGLSGTDARKVIRKSEGAVADMCLRLWQELMQLQASTASLQPREDKEDVSLEEKEYLNTVPTALSECRESLQRLLPVPHFLASVGSLLKDEDTENSVRKRAIQLLSERAMETDPLSPEASLFLEMVPDLVKQVTDMSSKDKDDVTSRRITVVQQGALISIECLARTFCLSPGKKNTKGIRTFLDALSKLSGVLNDTSKQTFKGKVVKESAFDDAKSQLLSSAAVCSSTLVRVIGSKCLPFLQKLMKPLLYSLSSVNSQLVNLTSEEEHQAARLLQLSLLRALIAVTETVPQFLVPFLGEILSATGLPSWSLRQEPADGDDSVCSMAMNLDRALASGTPARQLIPAASKAIQKALVKEDDNMCWREAQSIFSIMKCSIEVSSRSDVNPVIGKLINALLLGYGYDSNTEGRAELLSSANECLLAIVMKLSENQLRPLYARLREWRGDVDESEMEKTSYSRRYAFWSLSAALSKELRSIFLPCMSTVVGDAVVELDFAVSKLCSSHLSKTSGGKKRRRLDQSGESNAELSDLEELSPLQPLLLCLELALKADAHEGGGWARSDDGQRYNAILNPLGKLLEASIPSDFRIHSSLGENKLSTTSPYQQLVCGVGTVEHGNVIACLTALAAAAGNEQLWKPLNHAILQACGNDSRSEVRKAGVSSLLTIIQTLGEEYMVLLPECLPVLSELLEDGDEEIAGLAKECIRQGEELLGESLDDSLI